MPRGSLRVVALMPLCLHIPFFPLLSLPVASISLPAYLNPGFVFVFLIETAQNLALMLYIITQNQNSQMLLVRM